MSPPETAGARTSVRPRRLAVRRVSVAIAWMVLAGVLSTILSVAAAPRANALSPVLLADWEMNEAPGSQVMTDNSGNNITGAIGSAVQVGTFLDGATGYAWDNGSPTAPPPKPERLVQVNDTRLNPGNRDFAITVRFRTTRSYGNMIQKGQSQTPGGYFKWEIPSGILMCLFRSRSLNGTLLGEKSVKSPANMPLNDGVWHTVRCEKTVDRVTMTIDGTTTVQSNRGTIGSISNNIPLTIAGKSNCDQVEVTCDYFSGNIDYIRIEAGKTGTDVQAPTTPGQPTGESHGFTVTDLTWAGSTDNVSSTIQYRIYRDGAMIAIIASSASTLHYTDTGLAPGSTHTYSILASDLSGNFSPMSPVSAPIPTEVAPLGTFVDDFSSGFNNWNTVTGMTIDGSIGDTDAPSARVQVNNLPATASKVLASTLSSACASVHINATALVSNSILMRLRTAADGNILRLFVDTAGMLRLRSDVSSVQSPASVPLGTGAWHTVEVCGTVGAAGSWSLYRDGVLVLNQWVANTGTTPIGRIELGDFNARTWTANYDTVVVDSTPGEHPPNQDTTPPTTPGQPSGTSTSAGRIDLTWGASTDPSPPITYRIYRDGGASPVGQTTGTTFADTGLVAGSVHTYTVDAVDGATNPSPLSPASNSITVFTPPDITPPTTPGKPTGTSTSAGWIDLTWSASTDPSPPITYRIYRDGGASPVGQTTGTTFADTGLVAGSVHTYTVDAVDGSPNANASLLSPASDPISVFDPDITAPTTPGQPTGTSTSTGQIDLTWAASTDQSPITYRIYRDGGASPVGQTTGTTFADMGLVAGSVHTYRVDAVDAATNASPLSPESDPITVFTPPPDNTPPTTPGQPTGTSTSAGQIDLTWAASTDDSPPITYRIYRDGGASPVGQTTGTTFADMGLEASSVHSYTVDAVDGSTNANASPLSPASGLITVFSPPTFIFADDFSTGNLANWSGVTRLTIDAAQGSSAAPSARALVSGQSAWAFRTLGATYASACMSVNVNASSLGGNTVDLLRLRTATDGPISRVMVNASGVLIFRSDVSGVQQTSGIALGNGWHNVELCGTVGAAGTWDLYRDGVMTLNAVVANTGTTPIGRIQIGDTAAKTFTINWDDVRLDLIPG
ncbi:MAG: LamG domain-containing protein [Actinomycetota bacterium]